MLDQLLNTVLPIIIAVFCIIFIIRMAKSFTGGFKVSRKTFQPESVGDRLKKYIILAAKANPNKSKVLKLKRTPYNEGGIVGYIYGTVTTGDVTRFVFRTSKIFSFKKILYCPVSMHGSLHHKEVFLHAISLTNDGGFYFPVPYEEENFIPYTICYDAFKKDLKKLERMDVQQIEIEQVASAMIGEIEADKIIRAPEELPVTESGSDDYA
jgi:hypothetical protein